MKHSEFKSETAKYRHVTQAYCAGCGIDIASNGDPVVPWAWNLELPKPEFDHYNDRHPPLGPIQLRGHGNRLPVDDASLDFVYSSHLLEDYADWNPVLKEWVRVLKPGGTLVVLIPDKARWKAMMDAGQPPNDAHRHEGQVGELTGYAPSLGLEVICDKLMDCVDDDYSILFVAKKR